MDLSSEQLTTSLLRRKQASLHNNSWPLLNRRSVAPVCASTTCTEPFPSPTHNNLPSLRQDTLWATSFNFPTDRDLADSTARPARIERTFTSKPAHTASLCVGAPSAPLTRPGPKAHATTGLAKSTLNAALTLLQYLASDASACCKVVLGGAGVRRVRLKADIVAVCNSVAGCKRCSAFSAARDRSTCSSCKACNRRPLHSTQLV